MREMRVRARVLVRGQCAAPALVLDEPLSLWGGLDASTGRIIDRHHPQVGEVVCGRVMVLPSSRGSSSGSSVLVEAIRSGSGPAGMVVRDGDAIITVGGLVAAELYPERAIPVVEVGDDFECFTGETVTISLEGSVTVTPGA